MYVCVYFPPVCVCVCVSVCMCVWQKGGVEVQGRVVGQRTKHEEDKKDNDKKTEEVVEVEERREMQLSIFYLE